MFKVQLPVIGAVAFKRLKLGASKEALLSEAAPLWQLRHPNIVALFKLCLDDKALGKRFGSGLLHALTRCPKVWCWSMSRARRWAIFCT